MRRHRILSMLGACCTALGCSEPTPVIFTYDGVDPNGDLYDRVEIDGDVRIYTVHIPPTVTAAQAAPMIIAFHGAGQDGNSFRTFSGLDTAADARGFITVFPKSYSVFAWAVGSVTAADSAGIDDLKFVRTILDRVTRDLNIDERRIFATGISNGAVFTHRLGCQLGDRFAGIASVAATMLENISDGCDANPAVAALFAHGTDDLIFLWEGETEADGEVVLLSADQTAGRWAARNGCAASPTVELLPDTANDGTTTERRLFGNCTSGAPVAFYAITGGGHTWPGRPPGPGFGNTSQDFSINEAMLDFFAAIDHR